jgi:hypothetical protein
MFTEEQKQKYKKWIDNGRPLYHIDKSKEPTTEEHRIFQEMEKQQGSTYTITEHKPEPIKPKQPEKTTDELIAEARSLIAYNQREKEKTTPTPKPEPQQQKPKINEVKRFESLIEEVESQARVNKPRQIFKLPKTIFDAFDY